jgi:hypothetical protein
MSLAPPLVRSETDEPARRDNISLGKARLSHCESQPIRTIYEMQYFHYVDI